jgi:hypothetical protein
MRKDATSSENVLQVNQGAPTMCQLASKGGKDQYAWMENSRGPRWKDRKFMHKDPSDFIVGMTTSKWHKWRGASAKCQDEPRGEEQDQTGLEKAQAGQPVRTGPARFCVGSHRPFFGVNFVEP